MSGAENSWNDGDNLSERIAQLSGLAGEDERRQTGEA